jgi:hypothetical protein
MAQRVLVFTCGGKTKIEIIVREPEKLHISLDYSTRRERRYRFIFQGKIYRP